MGEESNEHGMDLALAEALKAQQAGEVPIGAVVMDESGTILGAGHNLSISTADATAHAEIIAIRNACRSLRNYRLPACTLYSTIEPCPMCAGAMVHARIRRLVLGAPDSKAGAAGSIYNVLADPRLNHQVEVVRGVRSRECANLIQQFFRTTRTRSEGERPKSRA